MLGICSGCDNLVGVGVQYCDECRSYIAQGDWEDSYEEEVERPYCDECGSFLDGHNICRNQNCAASPDLGKNLL
jgi:NMD protein affecting ribosome stability and mRNA decay